MKFSKSLLLSAVLGLATIFGLTACDSGPSTPGSTGQMKVNLTDAPADYDAVTVNIEQVEVRNAEDAGNTDSEEGWITILEDPLEINLLNLQNGNEITLGNKELETGRYTQLRLILGTGNTVTIDGETFNLQTPSAQQTGVKLNIDATIQEDETYSLLVDFDAGQSVVKQGSTNEYLLKPVLHAVNVTETGSIAGTVEPADFQTYVMAVSGEDTLSSYTADNGEFTIQALAPGSYDVTFQPESDQYQDSTQTDIEVNTGEETDLGTVTLTQ